MSNIKYTFVYKKNEVVEQQTFVFEQEPTFDEVNQQMQSYQPDEIIDYIREDV